MVEKVLVTGGLDMVGAFACRALIAKGRRPVIYDVSTSTRSCVTSRRNARSCKGNAADLPRLAGALKEHRIGKILHFGGAVGRTCCTALRLHARRPGLSRDLKRLRL